MTVYMSKLNFSL